jgi:hypothetical protein
MRFLRLDSRRRKLAVQSVVWLVVVRLGLRVMPYQKMYDRLERRAARQYSVTQDITEDVVWAVNGTAAWIPGTRCLPKALVGRYLLRRSGCDSRVRFGVTKQSDGAFAAHAWLENGECVLIGGETMLDYSPMPVWPPDAA